MAHPFYGNYVKASSDPSFSKLQDYITQAARLYSNERIARKAQEGAKERLTMELDSQETRYNRTENRLDKDLNDMLKTRKLNRYVTRETEEDRQEMFPIRKEMENE